VRFVEALAGESEAGGADEVEALEDEGLDFGGDP
jgi:hypothetical protein